MVSAGVADTTAKFLSLFFYQRLSWIPPLYDLKTQRYKTLDMLRVLNGSLQPCKRLCCCCCCCSCILNFIAVYGRWLDLVLLILLQLFVFVFILSWGAFRALCLWRLRWFFVFFNFGIMYPKSCPGILFRKLCTMCEYAHLLVWMYYLITTHKCNRGALIWENVL